MGLFHKPEVVILKESCDSIDYLEKLQKLRSKISDNSTITEKIDKEIAITEAGIYGENSVLFELKNSGIDLVVLRVTPYVNVIIECKNLFGNIEINNKGDFIRTFDYKGHRYKEGIYSPITQNERHLEVYKNCFERNKGLLKKFFIGKYFTDYNKSIVVLANPKTVVNDKFAKKEIKQQVIRGDQLINYLKSQKSDVHSNIKSMIEIGERVLDLNVLERSDYFNKYEKLAKDVENEDNSFDKFVCPKCGGQLIIRTAKKD